MSGYGNYSWTCGRCGESFSGDGVVGDMKVDRFRGDHMRAHREWDRWSALSLSEQKAEEQAHRDADRKLYEEIKANPGRADTLLDYRRCWVPPTPMGGR